jgi:hypothetical protein
MKSNQVRMVSCNSIYILILRCKMKLQRKLTHLLCLSEQGKILEESTPFSVV